MNLIIVESPAKAKTISYLLGKNFSLTACLGHIRDLPKSELGVDLENNFNPRYVIPLKSRKTVSRLKKETKQADKIILATDEDREGEAIAWHLTKVLDLGNSKFKIQNSKLPKIERIVFHEITKPAIENALKNPREINMNLVNAQQARRILDRLVGYLLSPFLWKKIVKGLSAGRVQSPALRLIVEREKEIQNFKPEEYWTIVGSFLKIKGQKSEMKPVRIEADLYKINGKLITSPGIKDETEVKKIQTELENEQAKVLTVKESEVNRQPPPPFTTSTLQQAAWQILRFPAKKTMFIAQKLYEGKDLKIGRIGLITYMRTDSLHLSPLALMAAKNFLLKTFGESYTLTHPRIFKSRSRLIQEAHEAIRPTDPFKTPETIKEYLEKDEFKLYQLIWSRFLASQMPAAKYKKYIIFIEALTEKNNYQFRKVTTNLQFDGFLKINFWQNLPEEKNLPLPSFEKDEPLLIKKIIPQQHFTKPPARFNDASLIKVLEEYGIGRPSTYAPIIAVLQERNYVIKNSLRSFVPTELGILITEVLTKHFPQIVDYQFTSLMEDNLDSIAQNKLNWKEAIKRFYLPFKENLDKKYEEVVKEDLISEQITEEKCEICGKQLVIKMGRFGKFLACPGFPQCRYTKSLNNNRLEIKCPKCEQGDVLERRSKKGRMFYGCSRWPNCDFLSNDKPTGNLCLHCGKHLVEKNGKIKCSNKICVYEHKNRSNN